MDERFQYRRLLRSFAYRLLDNELLSAEGDSKQTMVNALALIGAFSVTLALCYRYKYGFMLDRASAAVRDAVSWGDKEFLISLSMAVVAFVSIVAWDGLFPDRRECLTLHALPIRFRTVFAAKLTAVLLMFAVVTAALNAPTAVAFPWFLLGDHAPFLDLAANIGVHALVVFCAGAFAFFSLLGLQGLLAAVLSFRQYKWISGWIQMGVLFAILSAFFLIPDIAHPQSLADPRNRLTVHLLPPFWFLGLYEEMLGKDLAVVHELAGMARMGLLLSMAGALAAYALGYGRYVRKTIEEADAITAGRGKRAGPLNRMADRVLLRRPIERAAFHFTARTMARNRKHRLLLAIYAGVGLAYVLNGVGWLIQGHADRVSRFDATISSIPLVLSFFMLLGMRVLFTLPVELQANWIFQLTETGQAGDYLGGVRKLMIAIGIAPLVVGTFPIYGSLWGWAYAARHMALVTLILLVALEYLMRGFPKIPFTCSFLPGKTNLKATIGIYIVAFVFFSFVIARIELALVRARGGYWIGMAIIASALAYRAWRRIQFERCLKTFVYEERPDWKLASLDLQT